MPSFDIFQLPISETWFDYFYPFILIIISGIALIFINSKSSARQRKQKDEEKVDQILNPLLRSLSPLVSRISEILITGQDEIVKAIVAKKDCETSESIPTINRLDSTCYRLFVLLYRAREFDRETSVIVTSPKLERIEFFLSKIATILRGNLYQTDVLSTEVQEAFPASYASHLSSKKETLNIDSFMRYLHKCDNAERNKSYFRMLQPIFLTSCKRKKGIEERRYLSLAHLSIYLIDFYQELAEDPHWEEYRLYYCSVIKKWNNRSDTDTRHCYLYEENDLQGNKYPLTYPSRFGPQRQFRHKALTGFRLKWYLIWLRWSVIWFRKIYLNHRGGRYKKRHHVKKINNSGVAIGKFHFRYEGTLNEIREELKRYIASFSNS